MSVELWTEKALPTIPQTLLLLRRWISLLKGQIPPSGLPCFIVLHQDCTNQAQTRSFVWEDPNYFGSTLDFLTSPFKNVRRTDETPM